MSQRSAKWLIHLFQFAPAASWSNYSDYEVTRMSDVPNIEVRVVSTDNPPTGAGEDGVPVSQTPPPIGQRPRDKARPPLQRCASAIEHADRGRPRPPQPGMPDFHWTRAAVEIG